MSIQQLFFVNVRFLFSAGKQQFTVEYVPSLKTWYIFKDEDRADAVSVKPLNGTPKSTEINHVQAEEVLQQYLNDIDK